MNYSSLTHWLNWSQINATLCFYLTWRPMKDVLAPCFTEIKLWMFSSLGRRQSCAYCLDTGEQQTGNTYARYGFVYLWVCVWLTSADVAQRSTCLTPKRLFRGRIHWQKHHLCFHSAKWPEFTFSTSALIYTNHKLKHSCDINDDSYCRKCFCYLNLLQFLDEFIKNVMI